MALRCSLVPVFLIDPAKDPMYDRARTLAHAFSQILAIDFSGFTGTKKGGYQIPLPAPQQSP
jgi:hypothetical protein